MGKAIVSGAGRASLGILASSLEVGTVVKLMEDGVATDFIVVNQGNPDESLYDASCNGTWLLRKDIKTKRQWNTSSSNDAYANSAVDTWLNNTYIGTLGDIEQTTAKQVKIPYLASYEGASYTGANGLSCKGFLLSATELGSENSWARKIGVKLGYFDTGHSNDPKRVAYYNGEAVIWWTRSPGESYTAFTVYENGSMTANSPSLTEGVRPALIIPSTSRFDPTTLLLKG